MDREIERLRSCELKLERTMAKLEERKQEMEKQDRIIKEMKQQEIEGCVHIKELEVTNQQREVRKMELEEKLRNMEEEIRKLYEENGGLKNKSEVGIMQTPTTSFADILKKRQLKSQKRQD